MATPIRLGVIEAGSAQFSLGLVRDLCLTEYLAGSNVCLMDIDEERVRMVHHLAVRYIDEVGVDLRFESTLDRDVALRDTDIVINTVSSARRHYGGASPKGTIAYALGW